MGKHSAERRSPLPAILGAVAVLAIAAAVFIGFRAFGESNPSSVAAGIPTGSSTSSTSSATSTTTTSSVSSTTPAAPTTSAAADADALAALRSCVARQAAAKPLVDAVTTGAQHWGDHVQGQTDIDSGARSLVDVKTNTWGPTRAAGPGDVSTYQSALTGYEAAPACTDVGKLPAGADLAPKLAACAAHEQALDAFVDLGKKVMNDWAVHLSEMADHADGHINSAQAQANWLQRWREAPADLDPWHAAAATLSPAPACTA